MHTCSASYGECIQPCLFATKGRLKMRSSSYIFPQRHTIKPDEGTEGTCVLFILNNLSFALV